MTGKSVKCINCSANLDVPEGVNQIFCVYCGTQNLLADVLEIPGLTLICLSCNTKNKDDHLFCSKCGGKLKEKCPCCGQAHPFNTVFCPVKGLNIKEYKGKKPDLSSETKAEEFNSKGLDLYKKQKYEEAIKYYDKAIEADPLFPQPWNNKGIIYYSQDKLEEAIKCYDKAIELHTDYGDAWNNKGKIFDRQKRYKEAIRCFDKAIEADPDCGDAWNSKGKVLYSQWKYDEALECFIRASNIKPEDLNILNNRGEALFAMGKFYEAIECYDKALKIKSSHSRSRNNKEKALKELHK